MICEFDSINRGRRLPSESRDLNCGKKLGFQQNRSLEIGVQFGTRRGGPNLRPCAYKLGPLPTTPNSGGHPYKSICYIATASCPPKSKLQNPQSKVQTGRLDFGFWILGFGFWFLDCRSFRSYCGSPKRGRLGFGFRILDFGFWISDFWISDFGFWISDLGFWILSTVCILHKNIATARRLGSADLKVL